MTIDETKEKLTSSKSKDRRRAAKAIGSDNIHVLGDALYSAYLNERKDKRTWETQVEMIISLGLINGRNVVPEGIFNPRNPLKTEGLRIEVLKMGYGSEVRHWVAPKPQSYHQASMRSGQRGNRTKKKIKIESFHD